MRILFRHKLIMAVVVGLVAILAGYHIYRASDPYARFAELCRSGTVDDIRKALAEGAELNPLLRPEYIEFGETTRVSVLPEPGKENLPQPDYREPRDKAPVLYDRSEKYTPEYIASYLAHKFKYNFLNYAPELPLISALSSNPDPGVAIFLIKNGAKDSRSGLSTNVFSIAVRRAIDENGKFHLRPEQFAPQAKPECRIKPSAPGTLDIIRTVHEYSPKTIDLFNGYILTEAVKYTDDPDIVRFLLERGATPDTLHRFRYLSERNIMITAAMHAANPEIIILLAKAGADIRTPAQGMSVAKEQTPIATAAMFNSCNGIISAMVAVGADPDYIDSSDERASKNLFLSPHSFFDDTPLMIAVKNRNLVAAKELIARGANVSKTNNRMYTALTYAVFPTDPEWLTLLLEHWKDPSSEMLGEFLHHVVQGYDPKVALAAARILLDAGAAVDFRDKAKGSTAAIELANEDWPELLSLLLEYGPDLNIVDNDGMSTLMNYCRNTSRPDKTTLSHLIAAGAKVDARDRNGRTPLMMVAKRSTADIETFVPALMTAGADIDAQDNSGKSVRDYYKDAKPEIKKLLFSEDEKK